MPQYGRNPGQVFVDYRLRLALDLHLAVLQQDGAVAEARHGAQVVRDEDDGDAVGAQLLDVARSTSAGTRASPTASTSSTSRTSGVDVHGDREAQPHVHAGGVRPHRLVDEVAQLGEGDDIGQRLLRLLAAQAEEDGVEDGVLAARDLRMKAGAQLEQRRNRAR